MLRPASPVSAFLALGLALASFGPSTSSADSSEEGAKASGAASPVFAKLRSLEGTWLMADANGKPTNQVASVFRIVAHGHSIQEVMFPGSNDEMVNMYFHDGDAVQMVHYCAAGNQPRLLVRQEGNSDALGLEFIDATGMRSLNDEHMHSGAYVWEGEDRLRAEWVGWKDGKPANTEVFHLVRKP